MYFNKQDWISKLSRQIKVFQKSQSYNDDKCKNIQN